MNDFFLTYELSGVRNMPMVTIHISLETLKRLAGATYAMSERNIAASHNAALDAETRIACSQVALEQHIAWNDAQCIIDKIKG